MAAVTSELVNMSKLASCLGVDGKTVDRWMSLLEHVFLIRRYPGLASQWFEASGQGTEVMILDSGLLAAFRRTGVADVARDRQRLGPLLECFVHAELAKVTTLCEDATAISHYRDKGGVKVDLVLTRSPGEVVGTEISANANGTARVFQRIATLAGGCGSRLPVRHPRPRR